MRLTRTLLFLGVAGTWACAGGLGTLTPLRPAVRLHHISIKSIGLMGGALDVVLAFHNPNRVALRGTRLSADLDIEQTHFGKIDLANPFQLTASDTSLITVPLTFEWSGMGAAARSLVNYGSVNYRINGTASVDTPIGTTLDVPFSGQGNVPLLKAVR